MTWDKMPEDVTFEEETAELARITEPYVEAAAKHAEAARWVVDHMMCDWATSTDPRERAIAAKVEESASRAEGAAVRARVQIARIQGAKDHQESASALSECAMCSLDAALHLSTIVRLLDVPSPLRNGA